MNMNQQEAEAYNRVALGPNAPMYAYYAERILASTGISQGVCLDAGCGGGYLGLALAARTSLDFIFLDDSASMIRHAEKNLADQGMAHRARTLHAQVQEIPLVSASVDLVVSRGSVPFWSDLPLAFAEIQRVLRSGGMAYIGGGLGPPELRVHTAKAIQHLEPSWFNHSQPRTRRDHQDYEAGLEAAGIPDYTVSRSEVGTWITFTRE